METIVLEIRAGVGGEEATLWANDLLRMYLKYAQRKNWTVDVIDVSERGKGIREAITVIKGKGVRSLTREAGVHRIQRVSVTEKRGRVHTSAASVAVLPLPQDREVFIDPKDIRVDYFRGQGAGGQHRNKTDSAARVTHLPTGIMAVCQDERSQGVNRERAMMVVRARLWEVQQQKQAANRDAKRRDQIGLADRSEKMRTYDVPEDTVFDHRTGKSVRRVKLILNGQLELLHTA